MNVMLVILGFQLGYAYYPMHTPLAMDGFASREACGARAKEFEIELPRTLWPPIEDSIHVPKMRWGCINAVR